MPKPLPLSVAFATKYVPEPNSGCWLWTGGATRKGYGTLKHRQRTMMAHRVSYELFKGCIPVGFDVCHKCDTPCCVNPDHLFVGSRADNMQDAARKGRMPRGDKVKGNVLSERDVITIRSMNGTQAEIGMLFGIDQSHVSQIKRRKIWAHI